MNIEEQSNLQGHQPRNPLAERRLILCETQPPPRCILCDSHLPKAEQCQVMLINAEGEAVVCPGPVQLCQKCEGAYVNETYYAQVARNFEFDPYTLVGFVDLNQLPPEARDKPLGEDPNVPIPLYEFVAMQALQKAQFD
jgi:hypothetical protein